MAEHMNRRRFIAISAAFAGLPLLDRASQAATASDAVIWRGQALGAPAMLVLNHEDREKAEALVRRVVSEVSRLERVFSLYREDSALYELNRLGALAAPPSDLVRLFAICRDFHETSDGAFDPAIQPIWLAYARHFSAEEADPAGPSQADVSKALSLAGFGNVRFDSNRVAFGKPGMALTLNGIAQGYITDRIVDLLRDAGVTSSLVDMGENRAIGVRADGSPWRVGLAVVEDDQNPDSILHITDKAVATSSAAGFQFDTAGQFGHIIDPRSGKTARIYSRMSVIAPDAATADALSTIFSLMPPQEVRQRLSAMPEIGVDMLLLSGERA